MATTHGVIATSDPRASEAGAAFLRDGGNAVDAAVAAALVLCVVEPQSCGLGGDGFLIMVEAGQAPIALDGSGSIPLALTPGALSADGLVDVPGRGPRSATVPGALALFGDAVERWGTRTVAELAAPAVRLAREGFLVRSTLAAAAARAASEIAADPVLGPLYAPAGRAVGEGERLTNPLLADCLATVGRSGVRALYEGPLARAIADRIGGAGGYLRLDDLSAHKTIERTPASTTFRDTVVWELPAPTQGPAVLAALRALDDESAVTDWRRVVDAVREGMAYAGFDLRSIGTAQAPARGDTTYIAVVDGQGRAVSLITSVFGDFGSHFGIAELGGPIGNRAAMLRVLHRPPEPGTKPPHTTIPAAVTRAGRLAYVLGVAGGLMQPQAQVQILIHLVDGGLAPQPAVDQPRFKILPGGALSLEAGHLLSASMPDAAQRPAGLEGFGAAQVVGWHQGTLLGGADHRRGGAVVIA
jgi:gamma-glutamyltranspeptidase/glutathione hydrolase